MEPNGKGITEKELKELPEVSDIVLWQDDDGPCNIIDHEGSEWSIGFNGKILSKRKVNMFHIGGFSIG